LVIGRIKKRIPIFGNTRHIDFLNRRGFERTKRIKFEKIKGLK